MVAAPSIDDKLLRELFVEFGPVHRAFVVRSRATSESEGYGFVEFACPGQATVAKTALAAKIIEDRSIRVDWVIASTPPQSVAQLRSRTLFIDKLPRSFVNMEAIEGLCNQIGKVTFCRLATSSSGGSRGFGFVDFADVNDAVSGNRQPSANQPKVGVRTTPGPAGALFGAWRLSCVRFLNSRSSFLHRAPSCSHAHARS